MYRNIYYLESLHQVLQRMQKDYITEIVGWSGTVAELILLSYPDPPISNRERISQKDHTVLSPCTKLSRTSQTEEQSQTTWTECWWRVLSLTHMCGTSNTTHLSVMETLFNTVKQPIANISHLLSHCRSASATDQLRFVHTHALSSYISVHLYPTTRGHRYFIYSCNRGQNAVKWSRLYQGVSQTLKRY